MNFVKDLFEPKELETYLLTPFPFNLPLMKEKLDLKLEQDPEYEVFAPLVYYKCLDFVRNEALPIFVTPYKYFVSNKGRVLSLRGKEPVFIGLSKNKRGYNRFNIPTGVRKQEKLLLHRAVACSFTPVLRTLGPAHPKDLHVNHLDGIKENCDSLNLEWCTTLENTEHSTVNGLVSSGERHYASKPVKGKVLAGKFAGYEFVLIGSKDIEAHKFDKAAVSRCCLGRVMTHVKCSWVFASEEDVSQLPRGIPEEIRNQL